MAYNFLSIILGNGKLSVASQDVGYLESGSTFTFGCDLKRYESAILGTPLELRGVIRVRRYAIFRAFFAEMNDDNLSMALGGHPVQSIGPVKRLNLGVDYTMDTPKIEFNYVHPNDNSKTIDIVLWDTAIIPVINMNFASGNTQKQAVEFHGIADYVAHPGNPFGCLDIQL